MGKPKILFKYRDISTTEQLIRVIDSINNNKIFFPTYDKLNDPLEGSAYYIEPEGYAGISITHAADEMPLHIAQLKNGYHVLAFSESCFSPSMWAYYANTYTGVCIGYWADYTFANAEKVYYTSSAIISGKTNNYGYVDEKDIDEEIYKSFMYKHTDWSMEQEWRIIEKDYNDSFIHYKSDELACVILGNCMKTETKNFIINSIHIDVPIFIVIPGHRSFGINLLDINTEMEHDGCPPPFIRSTNDLINHIKR